MAAVEEFEIGAASQPALAPRASRPRRRGDRPGGWVALATAAVAVGMLIAPVTLPRNLGAAPGWAGLSVVTWVIGTDETDAVEVAGYILDAATTFTPDGDTVGEVVVVVRPAPPASESLSPLDSAAAAAAEAAVAETVVELGVDHGLFEILEAAADKTHWVCEPAAGEALCTAMTDPRLTIVVDWPTS